MNASDQVRVRPAEPGDLAAVQRLLLAASLPVAGVAERFPSGYSVAEGDGGILAAAGLERYDRSALLRSVVVTPGQRSSRLGALVVEACLRRARHDGVDAIYLLTTTAAGYFPRFGFVVVDRAAVPAALRAAEEFARVCPQSAVCFKLELSGREART